MTLLEIVCVLLILTMLSYGSGHSSFRYRAALQLEALSREVMTFIHQLQIEAGWYNQHWIVQADMRSAEHWSLSLQAAITSCQHNGQRCFLPTEKGVTLLEFLPSDGIHLSGRRGTAKGGHLTVANQAGRVKVILSSRGRIRRCSEQGMIPGVPPCGT